MIANTSFPSANPPTGRPEPACPKRRLLAWASLAMLLLGPSVYAAADATANRLTVALLEFADETDDPESAHWRYSLPAMVAQPLKEAKAIRICPAAASAHGLRQMKLKAGDPVNATQARKVGEIIEARRVVWGGYRRQGQAWKVTAHVMNVATGKESPELSASATDWFEARDQLAAKILKDLAITPTEAERARMKIRFTTSPAALELYSQSYALGAEGKPVAEIERCSRQALAADPQCAAMYGLLAAVLFNQGKLEEGMQRIGEALKLEPESANAHAMLGRALLLQNKLEAAAKEFREAMRLAPDEPDHLNGLAEYHARLGEWMPALSRSEEELQLNPVAAETFAKMGYYFACQGERAKALRALKNAEVLGFENINTRLMTSQAYERLHEAGMAVEHYEKFLPLARARGLNPTTVDMCAQRMQRLKDSLKPVFVKASEPKTYSEPSLREALLLRLTAEELALVKLPLSSTPEMKRWAEELTRGVEDDLPKARALYEALARHLDPGTGGSRTARETYADWRNPQISFSCQEYARLYVALARDLGLKAFWVFVDRDYEGDTVYHACAGVLLDGQALLVDPSYRWFGVPHQQFAFQDDYQAVVYQLNQSRDLQLCRLAVKLQPDLSMSQFNLAGVLCNLGQWTEGKSVHQTALKLDSESSIAHAQQGILAKHEGNLELAVTHLRKAVELGPPNPVTHLELGVVLGKQGWLREARIEFREVLRYCPLPAQEAAARRGIAQINEKLGSEDAP